MSALPVPDDCRSCARCCFSDSAEHVRVFEIDWERMSARARAFTRTLGQGRYMDMSSGRCAALISDPALGSHACSIYDQRPDVCRSLARGTSVCLSEMRAKAGRPEALLLQLRRANRPQGNDESP